MSPFLDQAHRLAGGGARPCVRARPMPWRPRLSANDRAVPGKGVKEHERIFRRGLLVLPGDEFPVAGHIRIIRRNPRIV